MSNKSKKTNNRQMPQKVAVTTTPPETTTAPEVETPPEAPVVEEAEVKTEAVVEETKVVEEPVVEKSPPKVNDQTAPELNTRNAMSSVFTENLTALNFKLEQMDKYMGRGKTFENKVAGELQKDLIRILTNFITNVPPTESRKAIGAILDAYHNSPFMTPACMFKGIRDPRTKQIIVADWYVDVGTLFSITADPAMRFKVANVTASLDKISETVPPAVLTRLKEFFKV